MEDLAPIWPDKPFNELLKIGFDGNLNIYDVRYTLMHEIGHGIGLEVHEVEHRGADHVVVAPAQRVAAAASALNSVIGSCLPSPRGSANGRPGPRSRRS